MTDGESKLMRELKQAMADYDTVRLQSVCEALSIAFETPDEQGSCIQTTWPKLLDDLHARTYAWKVLLQRAEIADPIWFDHWRRSGHADAHFIPDADDVMRICAERDHPPTKSVGPEYGQVEYALCLCGKQSWVRADHAPTVDNPVDDLSADDGRDPKGA